MNIIIFNQIMSSKKAMKQAQKQNYARFKNNFSSNSNNPFKKKTIKNTKSNFSTKNNKN